MGAAIAPFVAVVSVVGAEVEILFAAAVVAVVAVVAAVCEEAVGRVERGLLPGWVRERGDVACFLMLRGRAASVRCMLYRRLLLRRCRMIRSCLRV